MNRIKYQQQQTRSDVSPGYGGEAENTPVWALHSNYASDFILLRLMSYLCCVFVSRPQSPGEHTKGQLSWEITKNYHVLLQESSSSGQRATESMTLCT